MGGSMGAHAMPIALGLGLSPSLTPRVAPAEPEEQAATQDSPAALEEGDKATAASGMQGEQPSETVAPAVPTVVDDVARS